VDAIMIGGQTIIPNTTVPDAPSNKAVALLDSGTSYSYVPTHICDAIYGQIDGARYDTTMGQWYVPCDAEIDMALQINGEIFPLHPLDVSPKSLVDAEKCVGSFIPQSIAIGAGQFDWLIGDNFLRSTYSVYDFGNFDSNNKMGNPFVQLLSLTDPNGASAEFAVSRGGTARTGITYNAIDGTAAAASSTTIGTDLADTLNSIGKYFPVMLAITALNAIVLLAGVIAFIVYMVKKNRATSRVSTRNPRGRLTPMPLSRVPSIRQPTPDSHVYQPVEEDDMSLSADQRRNTYVGPSSVVTPLSQRPENAMSAYNPVSMALTEDTLFVPPSPAYRKTSFGSNDRPKSVA
jgi:saccharopepsin